MHHCISENHRNLMEESISEQTPISVSIPQTLLMFIRPHKLLTLSHQLGKSLLLLSFDFVFSSEIVKSLSFCLDRLCHLAILCLDHHALTLHHLESLLTISLDRRDISKEDLVYQSLRKSLSLCLSFLDS
uniref:Uncharacterized protein n=1 Tax=Tanacetum cinerariifolium TaxID=118510 RepID=A0A699INK1_TANCI|nr:hypothetical protein [Tanacetum cinerariifolium]